MLRRWEGEGRFLSSNRYASTNTRAGKSIMTLHSHVYGIFRRCSKSIGSITGTTKVAVLTCRGALVEFAMLIEFPLAEKGCIAPWKTTFEARNVVVVVRRRKRVCAVLNIVRARSNGTRYHLVLQVNIKLTYIITPLGSIRGYWVALGVFRIFCPTKRSGWLRLWLRLIVRTI